MPVDPSQAREVSPAFDDELSLADYLTQYVLT
jgi:hypothetical protein